VVLRQFDGLAVPAEDGPAVTQVHAVDLTPHN
jgi:hypothetical protein